MGKIRTGITGFFVTVLLTMLMLISVSATDTTPVKITTTIGISEFESPVIGWEVPKDALKCFSLNTKGNYKLTEVKFYDVTGTSILMKYGDAFEAGKTYKISFVIKANDGYYFVTKQQTVNGTVDEKTVSYSVASSAYTSYNGTSYTTTITCSYTFSQTPASYVDYGINVDYGKVTNYNAHDVLGYADKNKATMTYDEEKDALTFNNVVYDSDNYSKGIYVYPGRQTTASTEETESRRLSIYCEGTNSMYMQNSAAITLLNSNALLDLRGNGTLILQSTKTTKENNYTECIVLSGGSSTIRLYDNVKVKITPQIATTADTENTRVTAIQAYYITLKDNSVLDLKPVANVKGDKYDTIAGRVLGKISVCDHATFGTTGFDINNYIHGIAYEDTLTGLIGTSASDAIELPSGKYYVDEKYNSYDYIRVIGKPKKTTFTSVENVADGISLSWEKSDNASGYRIYRKEANGDYVEYKVITSSGTLTFTDTEVQDNTDYTYQIAAYCYNSYYNLRIVSEKSEISTCFVKAHSSLTGSNEVEGIRLSFDTSETATGYRIYRKDAEAKSSDTIWTLVGEISDNTVNSSMDTTTVDGAVYTYCITSYITKGSNCYESYLYESVPITRLAPRTVTTTNNTDGSIEVSWNKNAKAAGYELEYSTGTDAKVIDISSGSTLSKLLTGLTLGTKYDIRVRVYMVDEGNKSYSPWSTTKSVTSTATASSVTLEKTTYTYTGSQIKPTVLIKDKNGKTLGTNYYTVSYGTNKAVGVGTVNVTFKNGYIGSKQLTFKIIPTTTGISSLQNATGGIVIKWSANASAGGYKLYRSVNGGSFTLLKTITSATTISYTDTKAATAGAQYQYKVIAYKTVGSDTFNAIESAVKTCYRVTKVTISSLSNAKTGLTLKWGKGTGITGYKLYRSVNGGSFTLLKTITNATTITYTDTKVSNGKKYQYRVVAYKTVGSSTYTGTYNTKTYYRLTTPTISSVTNSGKGAMTVKWNKNASATGYIIKYKVGTATKTVTVTGAAKISRVIKSLTKGKTYTVNVRSFIKVGTAKYYSQWSAAKSVKIKK